MHIMLLRHTQLIQLYIAIPFIWKFNYTIGIKLSIYIEQNWQLQLQEFIYSYIDNFIFINMQIVADHIPTKQSNFD